MRTNFVPSLYRYRLILLTMLMTGTACRKQADLLLYNGNIYTVDEHFNRVPALVIHDGLIIDTGRVDELRKKYQVKEEKDLHGKPVFPGFFDPHCHFYGYGLTLRQADLSGTVSQNDIGDRLTHHAAGSDTNWIVGRGWDQNDWQDKKFPRREFLDSLFPDRPVYLVRIDGHAAWVNSKTLSMAGIDRNTHVEGGEVLIDSKGPTGILIDNAMALAEKIIPIPTVAEKTEALIRAQENCIAVGLTSVSDAGTDKDIVLLMDSLQQEGRLYLHINAMLNPNRENQDYFIRRGIYVTPGLSVRSIKLFADGALGSRGALLKKAYSDDPGNTGLCLIKPDFLREICLMAKEHGYQVNTHCIGDSAVSMILHAYARVIPEHNDLRWRIEHAQVMDPEDIELFGRFGIIPSVQTTHATSDMYWAEKRLGPDRIIHAYAYRSLLGQNGWLPNGSDFPVESINPVYGFYAAIARKDLKGYPSGGYHMEEALTREQAMRAMTIWAARAEFGDKTRGSLEPGKRADFVITDQDLMTIDEDLIPGVRVLEVYINGKKVPGNL